MKYTTIYDAMIRAAADKYLPPGWDWIRLKAQLCQESQLDPNARSPVGAEGIAQFMPGTWEEAKRKMPLPDDASPFMPEFAIPAMAWYDREMWNDWTNPARTLLDRMHLAMASYNAGFGNVEHAQRLAGGPVEYDAIMARLHDVTGNANAAQTIGYIEHIERIAAELRAA